MVEFTFHVAEEVAVGQQVAPAGSTLSVQVGGFPSVMICRSEHVPDGVLFGLLLDLITRGAIIPHQPAAEVSRELLRAVNASPMRPDGPASRAPLVRLK